ncbi:MAG: lamin tail domain-containing protein [Anaerolineae bacterium]|nr:lamin tail domain-containing protein [Anaerolineae bacterium]MDK1118554.1 lamin tail domain-containing protein [Anaerolineae bacterium]
MDRRKLYLYLLLNVFVSACVTGAVLFWYDRNYRASLAPVQQVVASSGNGLSAQPFETLSPDTEIPVEIVSVVGAGTLGAEVVLVRYLGEGELELANWQIKDEDGNTFTFPKLTLYTGGAVQVHTSSGTDTIVDLFIGRREPIWESGEVSKLFDPQNNLRAIYRVP